MIFRSLGDALRERSDLLARVENLEKRAKRLRSQEVPKLPLVVQMPRFPDESRAIPNYLARSPLFSSLPPRPKTRTKKQSSTERTRAARPRREGMVLPSPKGFTLTYNGEWLDQGDCDVFMQIVHDAQGKTLGEDQYIDVNWYEFLRKLDKADSGGNYNWLKEVIERLQHAEIVLETERYKFVGPLIGYSIEDKQTRRIKVWLNPQIVQMFSGPEFTLIDWEKRKRISKRVNLCKWLQNFICSHEKGLQRNSLENLKAWHGYSSPTRKFRLAMGEAMQELERVGVISGAEFYDSNKKVKWMRL